MAAGREDLLSLFSEIAIATVALSGITLVLAVSGMRLSSVLVARIVTQLRMAMILFLTLIVQVLIEKSEAS